MQSDAGNNERVDPLEKRPAGDQGDTAVPAEGDVAQQPQTVDEDVTPG
ncbi:MAG TPA: hypothetical protein VFF00_03840 [Candidatus Elarobacter sp.]|nr:hypothetical protein [Candidatus Elarobacter sp.]